MWYLVTRPQTCDVHATLYKCYVLARMYLNYTTY